MIAHCLFEQSGTFKNEFKKLGIEAYDYDILNEYGQTDYQLDLFAEIWGGTRVSQQELDTLEKFFPEERKQCEIIWKPVYEEYRRLNYRLKQHRQMKIEDYL